MSYHTQAVQKWATFPLLLRLRKAERHGHRDFTTSQLAALGRVSGTHIANLYKRGYLVKINPNRQPTEEFRYALADKYRPGGFDA